MSAGPAEVFGQYFVYEQLGLGGMARVDRAELTGIEGIHRQVALKRMLPHVAANDDMVKAFVREARLASHLRHANVAQTYEFGKVNDAYFIAMELVTGPTLREVLRRCSQIGLMPVPIALNILNQICDALDYAHNLCDETGQPLGIIHRDVSPSNIIIDEAGVVKLIDFGVAKASAAGMQTTSGMIKGKFAYMAPEYLVGGIDARADLFAVGVIAHELLTSRPLFSAGDDMETLRRLRTMPLQPPSHRNPSVPPEIDDIVMTALSRDPDHRWQHATALRSALTTVTKRLRLVCTNQQVVEWIGSAFEQTRPHEAELPSGADSVPATDVSYPSVQLEVQAQPELPPRQGAAASGQKLTLKGNGNNLPAPPPRTPIGTPARTIAAQPTAPSAEPRQPARQKPRASVPAFGRHEGLLPSRRNSDSIKTTPLRPSAPRMEPPPPRPAAGDAPSLDDATVLQGVDDAAHSLTDTDATEIHASDEPASITDPDADADADATVLQTSDEPASITDAEELHPLHDPPAVTEPMESAPAVRTRRLGSLADDSRAMVEKYNVTLLNGGAALRNRGAAPEPSSPLRPLGPPPRAPSAPPISPQAFPRPQTFQPPPPPTLLPFPSPPMRALTGSDAPLAGGAPERHRSPVVTVGLVMLVAGLTAAGVFLLLSHLT